MLPSRRVAPSIVPKSLIRGFYDVPHAVNPIEKSSTQHFTDPIKLHAYENELSQQANSFYSSLFGPAIEEEEKSEQNVYWAQWEEETRREQNEYWEAMERLHDAGVERERLFSKSRKFLEKLQKKAAIQGEQLNFTRNEQIVLKEQEQEQARLQKQIDDDAEYAASLEVILTEKNIENPIRMANLSELLSKPPIYKAKEQPRTQTEWNEMYGEEGDVFEDFSLPDDYQTEDRAAAMMREMAAEAERDRIEMERRAVRDRNKKLIEASSKTEEEVKQRGNDLPGSEEVRNEAPDDIVQGWYDKIYDAFNEEQRELVTEYWSENSEALKNEYNDLSPEEEDIIDKKAKNAAILAVKLNLQAKSASLFKKLAESNDINDFYNERKEIYEEIDQILPKGVPLSIGEKYKKITGANLLLFIEGLAKQKMTTKRGQKITDQTIKDVNNVNQNLAKIKKMEPISFLNAIKEAPASFAIAAGRKRISRKQILKHLSSKKSISSNKTKQLKIDIMQILRS